MPSQHLNFTFVIHHFQQHQWRHRWDWYTSSTSSSQVTLLLSISWPGSQTLWEWKMSRLCKLTMPLPFIQNFHQINFPPADLLPAFLGLPQTFYCLLPLCEPGHQAWWSNSDQQQAVHVVRRTVLGMSHQANTLSFIPVEFLHIWFLWVLKFSAQGLEQGGEGLHGPWDLCTV